MAWLHAVVDVPGERLDALGHFWEGTLGWPLGGPWPGHPELRSFEPPHGRPYVHLQEIGGPPRVHLDVESDDVDTTVREATDVGAQPVDSQQEWRTLRSPGGLPFCVVRRGRHDPPGPVSWPDGHRTRLVQVCVDSPAAVHDQEVAFWRSLLRGRWVGSAAPEFAGKWHDDEGSPVQLLFQRLEEPSGPVRAHVDLGSDVLEAEARRIVGLGADDVGKGRGGWWVLRDPAGSAFCVTLNSPEQSRHRDIG